jgi:molybdopterin molybdotransferase
MPDATQAIPRDVRMQGFAQRASVDEALEWVGLHSKICAAENIPLDAAYGRILAASFISPADDPPVDTAVSNGYALRSCETVGASSYNPLSFHLQDNHSALEPFSATLVTSGTPLPMGADAVVPYELTQSGTETIDVIGSVAQGEGVNLKGQEVRKGTTLIETPRPLLASDVGLISSFGIRQLRVIRRPLVRIILTGRKSPEGYELADANGPMLRALVVRDGGSVEICQYGITDRNALSEWMTRPGADLILVCGRTGTGPDDEAPLAVTAAGTLSIHGIAMRPGGSTGLGVVGEIPVVLLPGSPLDCLCAYDLLAGKLIRNLSGCSLRAPYRIRQARLGRKIVSSIGTMEICQVRLFAGEAIPLGDANLGGLASVVRADGFIFIPASLEGYAPGAIVDIHLYDKADEAEDLSR